MMQIFPNLYIVLVGPSGSRKGTAMGPGFKMLNELGIKMAAESITREALIRELKESTNTQVKEDGGSIYIHASLTIFSQELTVFLGYNNMQLMSDLCDWFDCRERWTYRTKNMGTDDIVGVWVNLFGATTPDLIQTALPRDAIGGGLMARIIAVYAARKGKTVILPVETEEEKRLRSELVRDLERISMLTGEFKITEGFLEKWAQWYSVQDDNPPFTDQRLAGYIERRPTHILKLSMIMSASVRDDMVIGEEELERSINVLSTTEADMPKVFSGVGKSKSADVMVRALTFIAAKKEVRMRDLMQQFYYDADKQDMERVIETLESTGCIKVDYVGEGGSDINRVIRYKKPL